MTKDDIMRMAREAGLRSAVLLHTYGGKETALTDSELDELRGLEYFAALVAAAEREACALEVDWWMGSCKTAGEACEEIAATIRARGE